MFYIKEQTDNGEAHFNITDENVYTMCPGCGCERQVDLAEVFPDGEIDLFGTAVYCEACSKKLTGAPQQDGNCFETAMDKLMGGFLDAANTTGSPNSAEAKAAGELLKNGLFGG